MYFTYATTSRVQLAPLMPNAPQTTLARKANAKQGAHRANRGHRRSRENGGKRKAKALSSGGKSTVPQPAMREAKGRRSAGERKRRWPRRLTLGQLSQTSTYKKNLRVLYEAPRHLRSLSLPAPSHHDTTPDRILLFSGYTRRLMDGGGGGVRVHPAPGWHLRWPPSGGFGICASHPEQASTVVTRIHRPGG